MSIKQMTTGEWWYLNAFTLTCFISAIGKELYLEMTQKEIDFHLYVIMFLVTNFLIELFFSKILKHDCEITNRKRYFLNLMKFILLTLLFTCSVYIVLLLLGFNSTSSILLWLMFGIIVLVFEIKVNTKKEYS